MNVLLEVVYMPIILAKDTRTLAITSIERYFAENIEEKLGYITAGG
jgi:Uncharacterized conserved protein (DUF2164)